MPLFNLAWKQSVFWDGRAPSLRQQALIPIQDHLEMDETLENVVKKLDQTTREHFARAFDTPERIGLALENFLLTLTSYDSKFDRAMRGAEKLSVEEQRGFELFMQEREPRMGSMGADCFHCHGGALDGRFSTLEQVLDHYSEGIRRTETLDPNLAKHPDGGLHLNAEDKRALIAFLKTLTDRSFEGAR